MNTEYEKGKVVSYPAGLFHLDGSITLILLTLLMVAAPAGLRAESLTFPLFSIDVASGWNHRVEEHPRGSDGRGSLISIVRPGGVGVIRMQSNIPPVEVSKSALRNLTNVDAATALVWKEWGDFSGYQHSYIEGGTFHRLWWLKNELTLLFIVYECDRDAQQVDIEMIDKMVNSIKSAGMDN